MRRTLAVIGLLGLACLTMVRAQACAAPAQAAEVAVPGHPFSAIASADGCWLFASLAIDRQHGAIAVLRNRQQAFVLDHVVPLPAPAYGAALSPDGRWLAVATGNGASVFAVDRLQRPDVKVPAAQLHDALGEQAVYVCFSRDGRWLFVSQERTASISVFDLGQADDDELRHASLAGRIPVASAPVGLAVSPDGQWLYATSEVAPRGSGLEATCKPETGGGRAHPPGLLLRIDVAQATHAARNAVVDAVVAGCNPVRVAVASDGRTVWVTARGSDALLRFGADEIHAARDKSGYASFAIGTSPVGLAVRPDGTQVWVALSGRFGAAGAGKLAGITLVDGKPDKLLGTSAVGGFPREVAFLPDGHTLVTTVYGSGRIELIPTP